MMNGFRDGLLPRESSWRGARKAFGWWIMILLPFSHRMPQDYSQLSYKGNSADKLPLARDWTLSLLGVAVHSSERARDVTFLRQDSSSHQSLCRNSLDEMIGSLIEEAGNSTKKANCPQEFLKRCRQRSERGKRQERQMKRTRRKRKRKSKSAFVD